MLKIIIYIMFLVLSIKSINALSVNNYKIALLYIIINMIVMFTYIFFEKDN